MKDTSKSMGGKPSSQTVNYIHVPNQHPKPHHQQKRSTGKKVRGPGSISPWGNCLVKSDRAGRHDISLRLYKNHLPHSSQADNCFWKSKEKVGMSWKPSYKPRAEKKKGCKNRDLVILMRTRFLISNWYHLILRRVGGSYELARIAPSGIRESRLTLTWCWKLLVLCRVGNVVWWNGSPWTDSATSPIEWLRNGVFDIKQWK